MEILGIDIGGSGIKGALVDVDKGVLSTARHRIPTPQPATPKAVAETINELVNHFNWNGKIGCGFPASIIKGIVRTASNIDKGWMGVNAQELFSETTNCKTIVLNDADAAGIAEVEFGAGKDVDGSTIIITVGTGIGTAMFTKKQLVPNTELGHLILNSMIAEHYASDAVRKKDHLSWKKWSYRFNEYLSEIERLLWPELIILGGGISKKSDKYLKHLKTKAEIVPAKLRNEAGIIGAAMAARNL